MVTTYSACMVVNENRKICLVSAEEGWMFVKTEVPLGKTAEEASKNELQNQTGYKDLEFVKELGLLRTKINAEPMQIPCLLFKTGQEAVDNEQMSWFGFSDAIENMAKKEEAIFLLRHQKFIMNS